MKPFYFVPWLLLVLASCQSAPEQLADRQVGGPCEGCEALLEYGDQDLSNVDTLPLFGESEPSLKITGTVYGPDGKMPAEGIILYIYHTNREGVYERRGDAAGWGIRHGYLRGWVRTEADGRYTFYTFRPAAYPNRGLPAHIHITVKEPGIAPYYIDDFLFEDDPLLTAGERAKQPLRGGSGIVQPVFQHGIGLVERDLFLGLNIPDYE